MRPSELLPASNTVTTTTIADRQPIVVEPAESDACPRRTDRRAFLRDMSLAVGAALVATGIAPSRAFAAGMGYIDALPSSTPIERSYVLPVGDGAWVDSANRLVLARTGGQLFAFSLECPHKGRMLEWQPGARQFYCPKHKARFAAGGAHVSGRRTTDLDRYALRMQQGRVIVALDRVLSPDADKAAWTAAVLAV